MARHRWPLPRGDAAESPPHVMPPGVPMGVPLAEPPMPWALLAAACFGMFAASSSGTTRAPFLLEMSRDLATSLPLVGNLMAVTSVAWGIASVLAGAGSDRWGRRPFLIGGPVALALCLVGVAEAGSFLWVAVWIAVAGGCAGAFTGVLMAEASARVVDRQRGRALGWVMAGQSLTLLLGVPMAAWIGDSLGWRGVNVVVAGVAVLAGLALWATTLRPAPGGSGLQKAGTVRGKALTGPVLRLLAMGVAERICYGLIAVYFATFLQSSYGLSLAGVVIPLAVFAVGSILGTVLGGQLADKLGNRRLTFAGAMFGSAALALVLFGWLPGLEGSVALGFAYVFVNAIARPSLMAALAEVPEDVRGTVLGLNVTSASIGWLGAAALGSWMIAQHGFGGFGPAAAGIGVLGGLLAVTGRR